MKMLEENLCKAHIWWRNKRNLLKVKNMIIFLTVVMASWVYTYIKTHHIVYFKMQFLYVIYTSMKLVKHFFLKIFIYLFIGWTGSCYAGAFSGCSEHGLLSSCSAQAFLVCRAWAPRNVCSQSHHSPFLTHHKRRGERRGIWSGKK